MEATFDAIDRAVLDALRPRAWRDRLHLLVAGGFTAVQVAGRVVPAARAALDAAPPGPAGEDAVARERSIVEHVHRALDRLVAAGRVRRRRARYTQELGQKGPRDLLVDLYALGADPPG